VNPTVYLMRHGRTEDIEEDRMRSPDDPLTEAGRKDVCDGAKKLVGKGIGSVVSSDLFRARQSANIAGRELDVRPKVVPALRTWDRGEMQGKKQSEVEDELHHYETHPDKKVPGGESRNDWVKRIEPEILRMMKQAEAEPSKPPLALTHTQVMVAAPAIARGEYPEPHQSRMRLRPGAVMKLEKRGGKWNAEMTSDGNRT
jgi:glucosyl-3-phosphoglycerate phosphatase